MEWQTYQPGDVIFSEGEPSKAAYLVVSGKVRIVKGHGTPHPHEIAVVPAGEYVGEMGAVDDHPRSATALAEGQAVCAPVTPEVFMEMLLKDPDEVLGLLRVLFERLRAANRRLAELEDEHAA